MKARHALCAVAAPIFLIHAVAANAADVGTAFTYQGNLEKPAGSPVTATCDFRFGLWNSAAAGNQVGSSPQSALSVSVSSGVFSATLDFGLNAMDGNARWLEMEVKCPGDSDFNLFSPRLELKPTPYALRASQGVGPPGALEVNGSGGVQLGNETGNQQITFDVNSGSMAAASDSATAPLTIESRSPTGSRTQIIIDESSSTVTITGSDPDSNVARVPSKTSVGIGVSALGHTLLNSRNPDGSAANLGVNTNGGNVGIGTTAPTAKLEIAGTAGVDGVRFPDGTLQTTAASVPPGSGPIIGEVRMWAGSIATIPAGWLHCDGRSLPENQHPNLHAVIGRIYGGVEGVSYNLPNLVDRTPMGTSQDNPPGFPKTTVTGSETSSGGSATHTLSTSQMPYHRHTLRASNADANQCEPNNNNSVLGSLCWNQPGPYYSGEPNINMDADSIDYAGGSGGVTQPHTILDPYLAITFIIYAGP